MEIREFKKEDLLEIVPLYCACFAEPPWNEQFNPIEVTAEMLEVASWPDAVMYTAFEGDRVVGAAYGFDLARKPDVLTLVNPRSRAFYVSEIFVSPATRAKGTATALVDSLLFKALVLGFGSGAVRTSIEQPIIRRLFEKRGWSVVATQTVVSTKVVDGRTVDAPDERIIMASPPFYNRADIRCER